MWASMLNDRTAQLVLMHMGGPKAMHGLQWHVSRLTAGILIWA